MISEHIHNSHLRNGYFEQFGALRHTGTYQQTTVWTTYDGYFIRIGILIVDKEFGGRYKIIEHILLFHLSTGNVPLFTVFITTPQVYLCINTSIFKEWNAVDAESRVEADAKPSVSIKEYRVLPISLQVFFICKEHRNHNTVFTGEEDLFGYEFVRVELYFRSTIQFISICIHIIFIGGSGSSKWSKTKKAFFIIFGAAETYGT